MWLAEKLDWKGLSGVKYSPQKIDIELCVNTETTHSPVRQ
jgi:hypothetical protein